eukprot:3749608-Pyramimonas_sp.AAC.1
MGIVSACAVGMHFGARAREVESNAVQAKAGRAEARGTREAFRIAMCHAAIVLYSVVDRVLLRIRVLTKLVWILSSRCLST